MPGTEQVPHAPGSLRDAAVTKRTADRLLTVVGAGLDAMMSKIHPSSRANFLWVDAGLVLTGSSLLLLGYEALLLEAALLLVLLASLRLGFKQFLLRASAMGSVGALTMTAAVANGQIPIDELWEIPGHGLIVIASFVFCVEREKRTQAAEKARSRLIATVSHDIRNPLTAALGVSELLSETPGDIDEFTDTITYAVQEALYLVEDLSTATRLEAGTLKLNVAEVDVAALLESVTTTMEWSSPIQASLDDDTDRMTCISDEMRLRQILRNLISNAQRYGGPNIRLEADQNQDFLFIQVIDDGAGIPPSDAETIFEPYSQGRNTNQPVESMGLGLASARQLARQMGGDLTYHRHSGETVFELAVPRPQDDSLSA